MAIYSWEHDKNIILEKMHAPDVLKLCAKVLDEPLLTEGWIEHHAKIVGYGNLIIADNMSTDTHTLDIYRKYSDSVVIFQFSGPHNQIHWHPRFSEFFDAIKNSSRFFSFVDVDERLVQISKDVWIADSSIRDQLLSYSGKHIIPTTWLVNKLNRFDTFCLGGVAPYIPLPENLKWGKPILPSEFVGYQPGIHNVQWEDKKFEEIEELDLFLLHLTQFPARRISTNRNNLVSRYIIDAGVTSEQVLEMDFSELEDQSFMPLVHEMRRMSDLLLNPHRVSSLPIDDEVHIRQDGSLSYSNSHARDVLRGYQKDSVNLLRSTFRGIGSARDKLDNPEFLLDCAMSLRTRGQLALAERLFRIGMIKHPHFPGKFGGPAFRKELVRMCLAQQEWAKADGLVAEVPDDSYWAGTHWHEILYARAYTQIADHERGLRWWRKVLSREPTNGEAIEQCRFLRERVEQESFGAARIALQRDLERVHSDLEISESQIHGFMSKFFALTEMDIVSVKASFAQMIELARAQIANVGDIQVTRESGSKVPKIIHRIWLTSSSAPCEPPAHYIESMLREAEEYSKSGWTHYFWTQDVRLIPRTLATIQKSGVPIKILSVDDDLPAGDWRRIFDAFTADRKFPFAADVVRMKILYEFGGIYADIGARFRTEILASIIVNAFDMAFIFWDTMFFQNSLMAMPKKSIIGEIFLRLAERPSLIPRPLLEPLTGLTEGMAFSGLIITAILLKIDHSSLLVCPLAPNAQAVEWSSEKSWYIDDGNQFGKFGNAYVPSTGPSFFATVEPHETEKDALFATGMASYPVQR